MKRRAEDCSIWLWEKLFWIQSVIFNLARIKLSYPVCCSVRLKTKNRSIRAIAVTGMWGSCTLLVMGCCQWVAGIWDKATSLDRYLIIITSNLIVVNIMIAIKIHHSLTENSYNRKNESPHACSIDSATARYKPPFLEYSWVRPELFKWYQLPLIEYSSVRRWTVQINCFDTIQIKDKIGVITKLTKSFSWDFGWKYNKVFYSFVYLFFWYVFGINELVDVFSAGTAPLLNSTA